MRQKPPIQPPAKNEALREYFQHARDYRFSPKDPYSHATHLLNAEPKSPGEFREMITKHVLLGNVNSDRMMRLYQNDITFLPLFFQLGQKDNQIKEFSDLIFNTWVFEVTFTRTKNGLERWLQNFTGIIPSLKPEGFGKGIFKRKPKGPMGDYLQYFGEGDRPVYE